MRRLKTSILTLVAALCVYAEPRTTYTARTDRVVTLLPTLPTLGAAGSYYTDPSFGTRVLRVTDTATTSDSLTRYYMTSRSAEQEWNADDTKFWVITSGGGFLFYTFNSASMTVAKQTPNNYAEFGGFALDTATHFGEPSFSRADPDVIYCMRNTVGTGRQISKYTFSTQTYATVLDLDGLPALLWTPNNRVNRVRVSDTDLISVTFNGSADTETMAMHYNQATGAYKVYDSMTGMYWDSASPGWVAISFAGGAYAGWRLHGASIDRTGRYITFSPAQPDFPVASVPSSIISDKDENWIWDTSTNEVYKTSAFNYGHGMTGSAYAVRNCCFSDGGFVSAYRFPLAKAGVLAETSVFLHPPKVSYPAWDPDVHMSWNNATIATPFPPVFIGVEELSSSVYADPDYDNPRLPWQSEIVANTTDGSDLMYRFGHHRLTRGISYHDTPNPNISRNGRWLLFNTNWELTLGAGRGVAFDEADFRHDVFLMDLSTAGRVSTGISGKVTVSGKTEIR
jgi:hypothetical protein